MTDIEPIETETQDTIGAWLDSVAPPTNGREAGIKSQALKLMNEIVELAMACGCDGNEIDAAARRTKVQPDGMRLPLVAAELADVVIVANVLAHRAGIDLDAEVSRKMTKNRARSWRVDPNGSAQHIDMEVVA